MAVLAAGRLVLAVAATMVLAAPAQRRGCDLWAWLDCADHVAWSQFRERMAGYRQSGFHPEVSLAEEADRLINTIGFEVDVYRFAAALSEPQAELRPEDCVYGLVAAFFVRGGHFLAHGDIAAAEADWAMALRALGRELGLDFLESTAWLVRSADLLLNYPHRRRRRGAGLASTPFLPSEKWPLPAAATPRVLRAVDPRCARWPCDVGRLRAADLHFATSRGPARPITVVVYGYHPVLIEPVSTLVLGQQLGMQEGGASAAESALAVSWRWYGVSKRDCRFFGSLCSKEQHREPWAPVRSEWRYLDYESEEDVRGVEASYRQFWEAERAHGLEADMALCMELRDAYFLWLVARVPTIFYAALIFLQAEAMSNFGASVYLRQFDELRRYDMLSLPPPAVDLASTGDGAMPPVAMVAQSPYVAENVAYHTGRRLPAVRPLALYVAARYAPNATADGAGAGAARRYSLLVLCARTRLMMSHACRRLFRAALRRLRTVVGPAAAASVSLHLPAGDGDIVHGLSFEEVAQRFHATVLLPWNIAVTTFAEMYAMHMPIFVPDALWLARLWPKQMTSYERGHPDLHRRLRDPNATSAARRGRWLPGQHPTPYPSLDRLHEDYSIMLYWAAHYAQLHEMPGVRSFSSVPALLVSLRGGSEDLEGMAAAMRVETRRSLEEVLPFWAGLFSRLCAV